MVDSVGLVLRSSVLRVVDATGHGHVGGPWRGCGLALHVCHSCSSVCLFWCRGGRRRRYG
jgi:hypothetical protein